MRIKLLHRLSFQWPEAARSLTFILRLTPRSHDGQRVMRWRIDVEPDCRLKAGEDHYGNIIHTLTIPGPVSDPRIVINGELATFDVAGVVRGSAERLPTEIFLRDTPATQADAALRRFADDATRGPTDRIARLHALMGAVHETVKPAGDADVRSTAIEAFAARRGTGDDLAHVFVACARHLGWPSRCVTGYHVPHEDQQRRHAWAEVEVEGLGWVAFDPLHDLCPQEEHIRTAVGLDAIDAAGLKGNRTDHLDERVEATWRFETGRTRERPSQVQTQVQGS